MYWITGGRCAKEQKGKDDRVHSAMHNALSRKVQCKSKGLGAPPPQRFEAGYSTAVEPSNAAREVKAKSGLVSCGCDLAQLDSSASLEDDEGSDVGGKHHASSLT